MERKQVNKEIKGLFLRSDEQLQKIVDEEGNWRWWRRMAGAGGGRQRLWPEARVPW